MTAEAESAAAQPDPSDPLPACPAPGAASAAPANRSYRAPTRRDAHPMREDPVVTDLVTAARNGDKQAWDTLVERYTPLVWSICRRHQVGDTDAESVGQIVWLQLLDHLSSVRHPAALAVWLATTTRRECLRVLRAAREPHAAGYAPDADSRADEQISTTEQELLLAERHAALREAMAHLPMCCRQLIAVLTENPPVPDAEISARLGIPIGSIGANRGRCLDKLRVHPAVAALINADGPGRTHSDAGQEVLQRAPSANGQRSATRLGNHADKGMGPPSDPPMPPHPLTRHGQRASRRNED
jgi:RNA polymerase sigma factor (sigma-70 family)